MQAGAPFRSSEHRTNGDCAAIAELTRRMCEAWNEGDASAYVDLFTEDCDYTAFDGTHLKGRDQNARHQ